LIQVLKHILPNFFRLGLIQLFSIVLQFLLIPLVISRAGIEENGKLLTALSISVLFSILINYGTNQSGPLALSKSASGSEPDSLPASDSDSLTASKQEQLSASESGSLPASQSGADAVRLAPPFSIGLLQTMRLILFLLVSMLFSLFYFIEQDFSLFLIGTLPILLAEVLNPYMVCISSDRLRVLAWLNFFGRLMGFLLVYYCWNHAAAYWVNAYVGAGLLIVFSFFWGYEAYRGHLRWEPVSIKAITELGRTNFPLLLSNLLVHLQQSLVLYSIGAVAGASVLGIYAIIDKLIWGSRMILISFSGAVFARALFLYKEGQASWLLFRQKINRLLAFGMLLTALALVVGANPLAVFLARGADEQLLTMAIRLAALVPLFTSLNLLNVLELILEKRFVLLNKINFYIFSVVSLFCLALFGLRWMHVEILFWMPVALLFLIEVITLLFYEKNRHHTR